MLAASELKDSATETEQRYLRHLDILLNDPDHKSVKAIMEYWHNGKMRAVDPFPAYADDNSVRKKPSSDSTAEARPRKTKPKQNDLVELTSLREKLAKLEYLPENEAVRFNLESEIYRLERDADSDEWPYMIGGA
jgi:hypothetical protein